MNAYIDAFIALIARFPGAFLVIFLIVVFCLIMDRRQNWRRGYDACMADQADRFLDEMRRNNSTRK